MFAAKKAVSLLNTLKTSADMFKINTWYTAFLIVIPLKISLLSYLTLKAIRIILIGIKIKVMMILNIIMMKAVLQLRNTWQIKPSFTTSLAKISSDRINQRF